MIFNLTKRLFFSFLALVVLVHVFTNVIKQSVNAQTSPSPIPAYTINDLIYLLNNYLSSDDSLYQPQDGKVNMLDAAWVISWLANLPNPTPTPLPVGVNAETYTQLEPWLIYGDLVGVSSARGGDPDTPIDPSSPRFQNALAILETIDETYLGITKSIVFSSYVDAQNLVPLLPSDITEVGYNVEAGMTPDLERQDIVNSVALFAQAVKASGRKIVFAPVRAKWDELENIGLLDDVLILVDGVGFQGQSLLAEGGVDQFISVVNQKANLFRQYNPNLEMAVQVWMDRDDNTVDGAVAGFQGVQQNIDRAIIWGSSPQGIVKVQQVLQLLRL